MIPKVTIFWVGQAIATGILIGLWMKYNWIIGLSGGYAISVLIDIRFYVDRN